MSPLSNVFFVSIITPNLLLPLFLIVLLLVIILSASIKVVTEYERAVIFRLGRLMGVKGPGVVVILPIIDRRRIIDLRLVTFDVPKQRIITKDNVTVDVDAIVYFRVTDPMMAVLKVKDYFTASALLAQTTLRDVIGQVELDDLLTRREELNKRIQQILDEATEPWGIKVTTVALRDVVIPEMMQRAIAKQAEAERERRSRIIAAEGELMAAEKMAQAADYYAQHPIALRLRELQTWSEIAREKNMIVVTESATKELGTILGLTAQKKE
ncbi:MAG: slipin family protein [Candidatus Caldarchaeum sp.]|uniref:Slipin family protein n=2 Tax=Caldiarchaeum subterraneum TaxID=311458 RepID=A0A7J3WAZ9_CALS0